MLRPDAPLSICYHGMVEFERKLGNDKTRVRKALRWPFQKGKIQAVITHLRRLQSVLSIAIGSHNAYVTPFENDTR